jgi:hypothetical protein
VLGSDHAGSATPRRTIECLRRKIDMRSLTAARSRRHAAAAGPWAAAQMRMHNELVSKGRRAFSAMSRCWPGGPAQLLFNAEPLYFIQTPQEVWILWQRDHLVRRVFLNRGHT